MRRSAKWETGSVSSHPTSNRMTARKSLAGLLAVAAIIIFVATISSTHAQSGETESAPARPDQPSGSALWVGMIDLHWNEVPGADTYEVQYFDMSDWVDLPTADDDNLDIDIAFYGAGAVVKGLRPSGSYTFRVRAVNSHGASDWSDYGWVPQTDGPAAWTNVPEPTNVAVTGAPVFDGSLEVGEVLTVDTSGISDENGLDRVEFYYQWIRSDGRTNTEIEGATGQTYTITETDERKTIKLRVWFTDRHGFAESLVFDPTVNVSAKGSPTISGTPKVNQTIWADTSPISDLNGLDNVSFEYQWISIDGVVETDIEGATKSTYTVVAADLGKTVKVRVDFTDDRGFEEAVTSAPTEEVTPGPNMPATGLPTISGTPEVLHTLTADISAVSDENGLDSVTFTYQWVAVDGGIDTEIEGATSSTYTLAYTELGKTIKVQVSFVDNSGNEETQTSTATEEVAPGPNIPAAGLPMISGTLEVLQTLAANISGISDANGLNNVTFNYQWMVVDGGIDTDIEGATRSRYTLASTGLGKTTKVRVSFLDNLGYSENLASTETSVVAEGSNIPAAGLPTIGGTVEVLQVLTADTSGIADEDGMDSVSFEYQWVAIEGGAETDIPGATNATYTLAATDRYKTIKVRISFDDDRGYRETLTSAATKEVSPEPNTPVTGSPTISGTAAVLQVLTASSAGIADEDGVNSGSFTYQWRSVESGVDTDIVGATSSTYSPVSADLGKVIKVRVSFKDNAGYEEMLTSRGTATIRPDRLGRQSCRNAANLPTPADIPVTAVPIVVESTTADYFVLYASQEVDGETMEYPVLVKRGQAGTTTLAENVEALPVERYRVEKYLVNNPADVDGDCVDDITELDDPMGKNPVNAVPAIDIDDGAVVISNHEMFNALSYQGNLLGGTRLRHLQVVKVCVFAMNTDRPAVYFINTNTHRWHSTFRARHDITLDYDHDINGHIVYHPDLKAPDGSVGVYRYELDPNDRVEYDFEDVAYMYGVLAASMPLLGNNLMYYPISERLLNGYQEERALFDASRIHVLLAEDVSSDGDFMALNQGIGYGYLRVMGLEDRPDPRDIVIYENLPNDLPRVAGIITTFPQTPLSHVNLRAIQDEVPNAFIRDATDDDNIDDLVDSHVYYQVTADGYTLRAATQAEVNAHYASSRPTEAQSPTRDLTVTEITPLSEVGFDDWDAFGVKAANVAVLGTLGFPEGTVPDGFAVPFYFYDEFMKHNELYDDIEEMLDDPEFQTDYDTMASELKKLRKKIKKGETPNWIETALTTMHATFPEGQSLRYRSSTNNEDLPNFNGAGLYDSKASTQRRRRRTVSPSLSSRCTPACGTSGHSWRGTSTASTTWRRPWACWYILTTRMNG